MNGAGLAQRDFVCAMSCVLIFWRAHGQARGIPWESILLAERVVAELWPLTKVCNFFVHYRFFFSPTTSMSYVCHHFLVADNRWHKGGITCHVFSFACRQSFK